MKFKIECGGCGHTFEKEPRRMLEGWYKIHKIPSNWLVFICPECFGFNYVSLEELEIMR